MPPKSKNDFLSSALALAEMGFEVVPANNRHPILKGWPTAATRDPEQIRKWIPRYESAFVAIVIRADGDLWALDADVPEWLQKQWGRKLPKSATVRSGGGDAYSRERLGSLGVSYITNPDSKSEDRKLLEIYLDKHCLLAPGTLHWKTGNVYRWEKERCIRPQPAPHEFVDFLLGLQWTGKSLSASVDGSQDVSGNGCRVNKNVEDLFAGLGLKREPTLEGFKFHPARAEKCPAAGRKHRGNSNSVWLFFYHATTRQVRFHCSGGSCAAESKKDRTRAALEALGSDPEDWLINDRLGKIIIGGARLHEVIEKCEQALIEAKDERLFQHGSELVHVTSGTELKTEGRLQEQTNANEHPDILRPLDVPFLVPATKYSLQLALSRTGLVFKADRDGLSPADPPEKWSAQIMDLLPTAKGKTPWPCIRFVTNSPTLLPNGDVIEAEGCHKDSGIWFDKRGVEFPPIPKNPTLQEAQEAIKTFESVYQKFDFRKTDPLQNWNETPAYSALLSTILSVAVRNLVPTVPMLAIIAPVAGTGKTLLADTIFGVTTGMKSVTIPFDNTEEFDKLLPTILRQGTRLVLIDNVDKTLHSPRLCMALTQKGPLHNLSNRKGRPRELAGRWRHLAPKFGAMPANNLTTDDVRHYIRERQQEGASNATVNRELAALKRMLNFGRQSTPPKVRAVPYIPMLKEDNVRTGFVEDEAFSRLVAEASELWLRTFLELAYSYGWRRAELLGLRVRQVDLRARTIRLDVGSTKNGEGREVAMTAKVAELLREATAGKAAEDFVLTRGREAD